jgi:iron complex outermembrane receptor protein/outer membrane receptor for ferrienterochelin and colicins
VNDFIPLVPKHKLNTALIYEKEGLIKLGLEGYFTGRQYLSDMRIMFFFAGR